MEASDGQPDGGFGRVPIGNRLVILAPKFKQRKVLAIRDFLPRCGRVTAPSSRSSSDTQEFLVLYVIRYATVIDGFVLDML
ncbi:hypothetical protein J1N35_007589 [Gossypium stocksii]|uniref:Uncharacterized protein n=1 Tax=Gossypium stocksii TaxID=47602 RepID=A0A9D4AFS8_9ROSI|nr:hypothetical protein J1N35_007589 [Gossypium stocksii]